MQGSRFVVRDAQSCAMLRNMCVIAQFNEMYGNVDVLVQQYLLC